MAYGHAKVDLGHKRMRKVNSLSNYALDQIVRGKSSFGGNRLIHRKVLAEAKYILRRRGLLE